MNLAEFRSIAPAFLRRIHKYSVSVELRAELTSEVLRARRVGRTPPKGIVEDIWKAPHCYDDFVRFLRFFDPGAGLRVFDVGANVGDWAAEMLRFFPAASITCIEPVQSTFALLQERFRSDPRVQAIRAAASDRTGDAKIAIHNAHDRCSLHAYSETQSDLNLQVVGSETVPLLRLDSLAKDGVRLPTLLKLDVQGHEVAALRGATELLPQVDLVISECSFNVEYDGLAPSFAEVTSLLRDYRLLPGFFRNFGRSLSPYAWERDVIFVKDHLMSQLWGW